MDIRGVNRFQSFLGGLFDVKKKTVNPSSEQDSSKGQQRNPRQKDLQLSTEQEDKAFEALLQSLAGSGLQAEKQRNADGALSFVVKDPNGHVVSLIKGQQVLELYLNRRLEQSSGHLLRKSA